MGVSLYLVGGSVRDLLVGITIRDLDLVTESEASKLASAVAEKLDGSLTIHGRFATATVQLTGLRLDFSTARCETYPQPGALPQVAPSGMHDDLWRRDFSINAMALWLAGNAENLLLDPTGGQRDLEQGIVRVLHPASFSDDPTRIFRAVRYEQRLRFTMAQNTLDLLHKALEENALATVSSDRVRRELELLFLEDRPIPGLMRAEGLGLLQAIQPGLTARYLPSLECTGPDCNGPRSPLVYLAALACSLSPQQADAFVARLNMPTEWAAVVRDAAATMTRIDALGAEDLKPSEAVEMLHGRHPCALEAVRHGCNHELARHRIGSYLSEWRNTAPYLKGGDLQALGVEPGPDTGRILNELSKARLDGLASSPEEEIALVRGLMEGLGGRE